MGPTGGKACRWAERNEKSLMATNNHVIEELAKETAMASVSEGTDRDDGAVSAEVDAKEKRLVELLEEMESVVVAFSGGVDSTYVAYVATRVLGERALSVTGESASLAQDQRAEVAQLVERFGFRHETLQTEELADPRYLANASNRCYFCKSELYGKLAPRARDRGFRFVVDGSTMDDLGDFRPGRSAANEYGVRSPLIEAGMSKNDDLVRLEIAPAEMTKALSPDVVHEFASRFRDLGFRYVTLDLHGYRTGAMNEVL